MKSGLFFNESEIGPWVCAGTGGSWCEGRGRAIGLKKDGEIVAGVLYEDWNGANIVCHIRGEGNWASKLFLAVIYDYPFNKLGVKRVTVPIDSTNEKCIKLVKHMGFTLESTLERATSFGDLLIFRMFKEDCKYLKGKYGQILAASCS